MQTKSGRWLRAAVAGSSIALWHPGHVEAKTYQNEEYGIQIEVPDGHHVCILDVMTHQHGFLYGLDPKKPCNKDYTGPHPGSLSAWADYNAPFFSSALKASIPCRTFPQGKSLRTEYKGEVRSWASCIEYKPHNEVQVMLTLLTGIYDKSWGEEAGKPCMIYRMYLTTDRRRLTQDLAQFREFIRSTQLHDSDVCSEQR